VCALMIAAQLSSQRLAPHGRRVADANIMSDEYELHEILLRCRRIEKKLDAILADNATHNSVSSKSTKQNFTRWLRKLIPKKRSRSPDDEIVA
jgi:hypothetical protein